MVRQVLAVDEEAPTPVHRLAYACAEDPAHAPPPTLLEETLLEEDRAATDRRRASLKLGPFERDGLGLAFSGGGVRAASFQSGVLWRMAELNLLKEVDHLSAVSGGGYPASALLTHISYGDEPLTAEHADSWYARKTASLIARCQGPFAAAGRALRYAVSPLRYIDGRRAGRDDRGRGVAAEEM